MIFLKILIFKKKFFLTICLYILIFFSILIVKKNYITINNNNIKTIIYCNRFERQQCCLLNSHDSYQKLYNFILVSYWNSKIVFSQILKQNLIITLLVNNEKNNKVLDKILSYVIQYYI